MERHPAGCGPSSFRSWPTPSRLPSSSDDPHSINLPAPVSRRTDRSVSKHQDMLDVPGIESALRALEAFASDVVQPVTRYNSLTFLNRFDKAALRLTDAFIEHVNRTRRQEIRKHKLGIMAASERHAISTYNTLAKRSGDEESDDSDITIRKRSVRLARKRPRPKYLSSDEEDFISRAHRRVLPKRSKEVRTNLNDDLAYTLMVQRPASPEKLQDVNLSTRAPLVNEFESSDEESVHDEMALPRVVRPLPFVTKRPLASDSRSRTPYICDDDDSTDTEQKRRDQARQSLKAVIYGPGKAEFTEKELLTVFPARSKRRTKCDSLVMISQRPPVGHGTMPSREPWRLPVVPLCAIPKEMLCRYINGTYWLSSTLEDMTDLPVFPKANGLSSVLGENVILAKQRFPSSDRETRDGDSGKASPATYVQSGSSTTGSPRAKKPDVQNGGMNIELSPSLSFLNDSHRKGQKSKRESEVFHTKNGKIHQSAQCSLKAWKDLAPYGKVPQEALVPQKGADVPNKPGTTTVLHSSHNEKATGADWTQQSGGYTNLHGNKDLESRKAPSHKSKVRSQSQDLVQAFPGQNSKAMEMKKSSEGELQSRKLLPSPAVLQSRPSQTLVKSVMPRQHRQAREGSAAKSPQISSSSPPNQLTVIARGSPTNSNHGLQHQQMSVQPQLSLQPQPTILTAVPVQIPTHQAGMVTPPTLHLQQYGQDPRLFSQWQLQNTSIQQTQGTLQLSPGYVGVNGVVTTAPNSSIPVQNRFVPVQAGLPIATNALVPAGPAVRPDISNIEANGATVPPAAAEPAQPDHSPPTSSSQGRQGNFNSQLQEQYQRYYEEMYTKHYQEQMESLKKER